MPPFYFLRHNTPPLYAIFRQCYAIRTLFAAFADVAIFFSFFFSMLHTPLLLTPIRHTQIAHSRYIIFDATLMIRTSAECHAAIFFISIFLRC